MRRLALVPTCLCAILFSAGAHALGLGEIEMQSALNQRLDAEIPLRGVSAEESEEVSVALASEEAFQNVGLERPYALTRLEFAVKQRSDGGHYVHITSRQPVVEPFLSFLVEVNWPEGNLLREYTVLLDPPVFASDDQASGSGAGEQARAETGAGDDGAGVPGDIERSAEDDAAEPEATAAAEPEADEPSPADDERRAQRESRKPVFLRIAEEEERAERAASERARAQAEADAQAAAETAGTATGSGGSATSGPEEYGPVQRGESLWNIASRLKRGDMTVQQMMLALLRYNPDAFSGDNINRLKEGYVLRVPDADEVRSLSAQRAIARVEEQNALWRQWRGDRRSQTAVAASEQAAGEPASGGEQAGDGDAELSIVGSDDGGASSDESASATGGSDASASEQLRLTREQLESARMEKKDMASRVEELEQTVDKMEKLLSVRNERLNALQEELRRLEEETGKEVEDQGEDATDTQVAEADGAGDADEATSAGESADDDAAAAGGGSGDGGGGDAGGTDGSGTETAAADDAGAGESGADEAGSASGEQTAEATTDGGETATAADEAGSGSGTEATASAEGEEAGGGAYVPENKRVADEDRGVQTTRTQPAQETWLDSVNSALAGVAGIFTGGGLGVLMGPVGLGAAAVLLLAIGGMVMMRRRRAAEEADSDDLDEMAFDTGSNMLAETDVEELPAEEFDATERTAPTDAGTDAESALMNEEFDLGALDADEDEGTQRTDAPGGDEPADAVDAADDEDASSDDTVAEADVYLAYGLHKQAEDLLRLAIKDQPERGVYREKLLETLYAAGKTDEFVDEASTFREQAGSTGGRSWQRVLAMGRELAPDNELFAQGETEFSAADLAPNRPAETDLAVDDGGGDLDFSFEDDDADGPQDFQSTMAIDRSEAVEGDGGLSGPDAEETVAAAPGGSDEADDLEFDLGELEGLDDDDAGTPATATESDSGDASGGDDDLEFDLDDGDATGTGTNQASVDDLDFDLDAGEEEAPAQPSQAATESADDGLDFDLDLDDDDTAGGSAPAADATESGDATRTSAGSGEELLDFDFDLGDDDEAPAATPATESAGESTEASAGDDDDALEIGDLDLGDLDEPDTGEGTADPATAAGEHAAPGSGATGSDADDEAPDLGDLDAGDETQVGSLGEAAAGADTGSAAADAETEPADDLDLSDLEGPGSGEQAAGAAGEFDLDDLESVGAGQDDDFDLGEFEAQAAAGAEQAAGTTTAGEGRTDEDASEDAGEDAGADTGDQTVIGSPADAVAESGDGEGEDFDTMLDLARAYIDMGDPDSAANALEEVAASGSEKQRSEAQSLLESVR